MTLQERLKEHLGDYPRFLKEAGGNSLRASELYLKALIRTTEKKGDLLVLQGTAKTTPELAA